MAEAFWKRSGVLPLVFFFLTVLSRIPFTSKLLYHMDSVHFALALDQYDITVHQPHPPGYFLYVMLGRLLYLFIPDVNTVFVAISILFSSLTVVMIFYMAEEIFDRRSGILAATLAIASPNLWFHGEVALSYPVEAFFSVLVAFFCWKLYSGKHEYIWFSAMALALAGGVRQNTLFFLFPLWLFSVKKVQPGKIISALIVLIIVCLSWFVPMVMMTDGWESYRLACKELWEFNTGHHSVFEQGLDVFSLNLKVTLYLIIYDIGAGIFLLAFSGYSFIRNGQFGFSKVFASKASFFIIWVLPALLFYLLIFVSMSNPGYALIVMPPLIIVTSRSIQQFTKNAAKSTNTWVVILTSSVLVINVMIFLFTNCPVSLMDIKEHDRNLKQMILKLRCFDPSTTALLAGPFKGYGYRHIMYYLPQYYVYQVDYRVSRVGEIRKTFFGKNRQTFLNDGIILPSGIKGFAAVFFYEEKRRLSGINKTSLQELPPDLLVLSGPVDMITKVYPETANIVKISQAQSIHGQAYY